MIAGKADCPAFSVEKSKSDADLDSAILEEHKDLFQYLSEHTGQQINNISDIDWLYSALSIEVLELYIVNSFKLFFYIEFY